MTPDALRSPRIYVLLAPFMVDTALIKVLLFIAVTLGPHNASTIHATDGYYGYVWNPRTGGCSVTALGFPPSDIFRNPSQTVTIGGSPAAQNVPGYLHAISFHDWDANPVKVFANGDRIEKTDRAVFYIIDAGAPNQRVFTITFPKD